MRDDGRGFGGFAEAAGQSAANASHDLTLLALHGLLAREVQGNSVCHAIAAAVVNELCNLACDNLARGFECAAWRRQSGGGRGDRRFRSPLHGGDFDSVNAADGSYWILRAVEDRPLRVGRIEPPLTSETANSRARPTAVVHDNSQLCGRTARFRDTGARCAG